MLSQCSISDSCLRCLQGKVSSTLVPHSALVFPPHLPAVSLCGPPLEKRQHGPAGMQGRGGESRPSRLSQTGLSVPPTPPLFASLLGSFEEVVSAYRGKRHSMWSQTVPLRCPAQPTATTHPTTTSMTGAATSQRSPAFSRGRALTWTTTVFLILQVRADCHSCACLSLARMVLNTTPLRKARSSSSMKAECLRHQACSGILVTSVKRPLLCAEAGRAGTPDASKAQRISPCVDVSTSIPYLS